MSSSLSDSKRVINAMEVRGSFALDGPSSSAAEDGLVEDEDNMLLWCSNEERNILKSRGFWDDVYLSISGVKLVAPFVALLAFLLAYHLTIAPYRVTVDDAHHLRPEDIDLAKLRPILSDVEMGNIQRTLLYAETQFFLPPPSFDSVHIKFHPFSGKRGSHRLPAMFYEGVTFGIGVDNPHNLPVSDFFTLFL